ncbi:hypothetical protein P5673_010426 [Acropora cervicornis]|uniref:Uncharacterized protein n=1 Tax=Acropora cervicornis TaxID=6130 RepID=A0AAD9V9C9_ACRCE|nr:hypothetical protein P5673_010426 [Acropora cervicornis]
MERHGSICLEKIAKSYNELEETDCLSDELIQSLRGPLDQLHTCERVNFENSSLADFKDLKQKLEYKLLKQTEFFVAVLA